MMYKLLDTVVLDRDLPEHGLRNGDLGAVVEVYAPDGLEVEFVTASGKTQALVTLTQRRAARARQRSHCRQVRRLSRVALIHPDDRITRRLSDDQGSHG